MKINEMVMDKEFNFKEAWLGQHPIIHVWCALSAVSIMLMSGMFFIAR